MSTEVDRLIQEKRSQLKDAFVAHRKTREAVAEVRTRLWELLRRNRSESTDSDREVVRDAEKQVERLESEERDAAMRFNGISEELAQLQREKYGEWHLTWRGPRPLR